MSNPRQIWGTHDAKASWVAVFILFLLWWLFHLLHSLVSHHSEKYEDGATVTPLKDDHSQERKVRKISHHFRDGLLSLLATVAISFAGEAPPSATNALVWIFTALWIILGLLMYFVKWRRLIHLLQFLDLVLLVAAISNTFARPLSYSRDLGA